MQRWRLSEISRQKRPLTQCVASLDMARDEPKAGIRARVLSANSPLGCSAGSALVTDDASAPQRARSFSSLRAEALARRGHPLWFRILRVHSSTSYVASCLQAGLDRRRLVCSMTIPAGGDAVIGTTIRATSSRATGSCS